ncbi:SRPBCC family protein [Nocardia sp. NPDC088792]|uniref:SRPBCC family protein n=1 Tax=Nocardia sp. NPDC088792 TaxID=3364332 RepID=UPI0037F2F85D
MQIVTVQRIIAAPPEAVFDWLLDAPSHGLVPKSRPGRLITPGIPGRNGVGAVREVVRRGLRRRQRITYYDRPREFRYHMIESAGKVRHDGASVRVSAIPGGTEVIWTTVFEITRGPGSSLLTRASAALLSKEFDSVLRAAEEDLIRTGELLSGTTGGTV